MEDVQGNQENQINPRAVSLPKYLPTVKERTYNLNTITHGVITIAVMVALYLLVRRLSGVLLPFLLSWVVAYLLHPLVTFFQYKCRFKSRGLSALVAMLLVFLVLAGLIALLVPLVATEMTALSGYVSEYLATWDANTILPEPWRDEYEALWSTLTVDNLMSNEYLLTALKKLAPTLWSFVSGSLGVLSGLAVVFVCLLYIFFILLDYEKMQGWSAYVPKKYRAAAEMLMADLELNMNRYFRGQALVASIVGVLFAIGFEIIGLPMGIVIGLLIGLLNMVPYLQLVSIPVAAFLCLVASVTTGGSFWVLFGWTFGAYCLCQVIQDLILIPAIMKSQMGLNPAIIFLALSLWAYVMGFIGLIIALPLTTLIISYYNEFILKTPWRVGKSK